MGHLMAWFKIDDQFYRSRKVRRLGADRVAAVGLWTLCGDWCADNLTDGFVPWEIVEGWDREHHLAERLIDVGLWSKDSDDGEHGVRFHDWHDWQPSKADVLAERAYNARKAALYRDPEMLALVRRRDKDRCRYCGAKVNWKDRRSAAGGTYDHVDPAGANTAENLVVACRRCNSRKGNKPLVSTGMTLLEPGTISTVSEASPDQEQTSSTSYLDTNQNGSGSDLGPDPTRPVPSSSFGTTSSERPRKRGTRIPKDFRPTPEMVAWARQSAPNVDGRRETEKFINYWTAKSGKDATKEDWPAVWRNWLMNAEDRFPRQGRLSVVDDQDPAITGKRRTQLS